MSTKQNLLTPTGRLLAGSLYKPQTTDADGKPLVIKNGANAGQPTQRFFFALGIKKGAESHWAETPWGAIIWQTGHAAFPQGQAQSPTFAWKVVDGDSQVPNTKGVKPASREGYPGHWVLSFSSSYAPRVFNSNGSAPIPEVDAVKLGYFVQVAGSVDGNDSPMKPGVYLNHSMVALQGYGPEIVVGPDPTKVGFGGGAAPAGMSSAPVGGMTAVPVAAGAPVAPPPAAAAPPPATAPAPAPVAAPVAVVPAAGFAGAPPPPAAPVPPTPAKGWAMAPKANGVTYEAFRAQGWTDRQLIDNGYMA